MDAPLLMRPGTAGVCARTSLRITSGADSPCNEAARPARGRAPMPRFALAPRISLASHLAHAAPGPRASPAGRRRCPQADRAPCASSAFRAPSRDGGRPSSGAPPRSQGRRRVGHGDGVLQDGAHQVGDGNAQVVREALQLALEDGRDARVWSTSLAPSSRVLAVRLLLALEGSGCRRCRLPVSRRDTYASLYHASSPGLSGPSLLASSPPPRSFAFRCSGWPVPAQAVATKSAG